MPKDKGNTTVASCIAERGAVQWSEARKEGKGQMVTCHLSCQTTLSNQTKIMGEKTGLEDLVGDATKPNTNTTDYRDAW